MSGTEDTPSAPGKIRLPSKVEITNAVEKVPTVEDEERPDLPLPEYLKPSAVTVDLGIDATDSVPAPDPSELPTRDVERYAGFTDVPSADPTTPDVGSLGARIIASADPTTPDVGSLGARIIDPAEAPERRPSSEGVFWLVGLVVLALVVAAVVAFLL